METEGVIKKNVHNDIVCNSKKKKKIQKANKTQNPGVYINIRQNLEI